jgi:pimeloyl-ACP methyl ester carboxylesterase
MVLALLDGLQAAMVPTARLNTHIITYGAATQEPIVFIHGNVSAARFFEETMSALPTQYYAVAPDLRGYGRSETKPVDATRGVRDFSDDVYALVEALALRRPHIVGWSLGGNVALQYAIDYPGDLRSLTLIAPGSPFGFGGAHGLEGTANNPEFSGSGGGTANPQFVKLLAAGDRSGDAPVSPRNTMNSFYVKPPFRAAPEREEVYLDELLSTVCSEDNYPGDLVTTVAWPGIGPGTRGVNNALSPKYLHQEAFASITPQVPVLWIRGDSDQIVADNSLFDLGFLGQIGAVPGWPGADEYPPQPMVSQMRALLERYASKGGNYRELVLSECGHSPHIERPEEFRAHFFSFISAL